MPTIGRKAQADAQAAAARFLKRVKTSVDTRKKRDRLAILAKEEYVRSDYITRIALAGKAQKVLNRVAVALREGRLDSNALDRAKLKAIAGEALTDARADLMLQNALRTVYNAGRYEQQMNDTTRTMLLYRTMRDGKVRPAHRALNGILLPKEHIFWKKYYPPNGHNCRCRVDSLTPAQAQGLVRRSPGIRTTAPVEKEIAYIDKVTGKRVFTPESIDPGWAGAPSADPMATGKLLERQLAIVAGWKPPV